MLPKDQAINLKGFLLSELLSKASVLGGRDAKLAATFNGKGRMLLDMSKLGVYRMTSWRATSTKKHFRNLFLLTSPSGLEPFATMNCSADSSSSCYSYSSSSCCSYSTSTSASSAAAVLIVAAATHVAFVAAAAAKATAATATAKVNANAAAVAAILIRMPGMRRLSGVSTKGLKDLGTSLTLSL